MWIWRVEKAHLLFVLKKTHRWSFFFRSWLNEILHGDVLSSWKLETRVFKAETETEILTSFLSQLLFQVLSTDTSYKTTPFWKSVLEALTGTFFFRVSHREKTVDNSTPLTELLTGITWAGKTALWLIPRKDAKSTHVRQSEAQVSQQKVPSSPWLLHQSVQAPLSPMKVPAPPSTCLKLEM